MESTTLREDTARLATGIPGLDEVLHGGLVPDRSYLVRGGPGSGKTIFGLHFLTAIAHEEEQCLFIALSEPTEQIQANAARFGFDLANISFLNLVPDASFFVEMETYDLFDAADVERGPTTAAIIEQVTTLKPTRIFVDSMTQLRYMAASATQSRKQAHSFLQYLTSQGATVVFTSESSPEAPDYDLQFLSDGIIHLNHSSSGRSVSVSKFRGSDFISGPHAMRLSEQGLEVFARLVPQEKPRIFTSETIPSGVPSFDALLHGGIDRGTVTIISGASGVGKTTLGLQFMKEAAGRGERSVVYSFEEEPETLLHRCESINIPVRRMVERGTLSVQPVRPWNFLLDEFTWRVRREVETENVRIVMIDSINGFRNCLPSHDVVDHLVTLGKYLISRDVTVLLVEETGSITDPFHPTSTDISYLADHLIFMRYLEVQGELRKAIGVLKKRTSSFEKTLREFKISRYGLQVGEPLTRLRGILLGPPEWVGNPVSTTNGHLPD